MEPNQDGLNLPCCPELEPDKACDVLDFHYRLLHHTTVVVNDRSHTVPVEVKLHVRLERCPGPMTLGDLVYSTTLLPGEKVRLFTTDRRSRFTFDSATQVSYRNEQTSEEHFYMASMSDFMSDLSVRDASRATNTARGSATGHGETSSLLGSIFSGPSVDVSGSYSAESTSEFVRELSQHVRASHRRSEMGARAASTVSIGEVQTRSHAAGQSEDHFESASREFANPNHCHAVTFLFYRIHKTQTIRLTIESIERRVLDPAADTRVANNPFVSQGDVSVIPSGVLATNKERLEIAQIARASVAEQQSAVGDGRLSAVGVNQLFPTRLIEPLPTAVRQKALRQVDERLVANKLLDKASGSVSKEVQREFALELRSSLPTPGILVRGCLDDCNICEPALAKEIELKIERQQLENALLKRQIELLDKAQEYRCCPPEPAPEA
jgi:hypothetical protein